MLRPMLMLFAFLAFSVMLTAPALADDVYVNGYTRKDGTYVRPHVRSAPDSSTSNNYGPSQNSYELMQPRSRDNDHDGMPNYQDSDDDNDGPFDNGDNSQYYDGYR